MSLINLFNRPLMMEWDAAKTLTKIDPPLMDTKILEAKMIEVSKVRKQRVYDSAVIPVIGPLSQRSDFFLCKKNQQP